MTAVVLVAAGLATIGTIVLWRRTRPRCGTLGCPHPLHHFDFCRTCWSRLDMNHRANLYAKKNGYERLLDDAETDLDNAVHDLHVLLENSYPRPVRLLDPVDEMAAAR